MTEIFFDIFILKRFWNQCDKWNNLAAGILVSCDQGGYKNHPTMETAGTFSHMGTKANKSMQLVVN